MFQSQKINNDPEPYAGWSGRRYNEETRTFASLEDGPVGVEPRPEYDNNPNPIMVAVRYVAEKHGMAPEETANLANLWLKAPRYYESNLKVRPTKSHREHARKVLTRLVNVFGTEEP